MLTASLPTVALCTLEVFSLRLQYVGVLNLILVGQFDAICLMISPEEICALMSEAKDILL